MLKLFIGIIKGAIIGVAVGLGAYALDLHGSFNWITYGVVGALVGFLVGRPLWSLIRDKSATSVAGILKAVFGFGVGCGLYWIAAKFGTAKVSFHDDLRAISDWQPLVGGAIGALWGGFIEFDDSVGNKPADKKPADKKAADKKPVEKKS